MRQREEADSPQVLDFLRREVLPNFPDACREALVRDPSLLEEWRKWLSERGERWLGELAGWDYYRCLWLRAWMDTLLWAAQQLWLGGGWIGTRYGPQLPREVEQHWSTHLGQRRSEFPRFPEPFWRDLLDLLAGARAKVGRSAWSVFPVVVPKGSDRSVGILVWWKLEELEEVAGRPSKPVVFPDPEFVLLRPMKRDFVEAMHEAALAARPRRPVRAGIVPLTADDEVYLREWPLDGPSGGGALYVGLRALESGLQPEPGLAISFAVTQGDPGPVGEVDHKVQACSRHGYGGLLVADVQHITDPLGHTVEVKRVRSLEQAEDLVLGLVRAIRAYVQGLRKKLDATPWPDPGGSLIPITQVEVEPRVLKRVVRPVVPRSDLAPEGVEAEGRRVVRPRRSYRSLEEARYYEEPEEAGDWEEVAWELEMPRVTRAVILGAPGAGKTFLSRWTVLKLIKEVEKGLEEGRPIAELPLPVHVSLPELSAADLADAPGTALKRQLLKRQLEEQGLDETQAKRVVQLLEKSSGWLVLDALDEVPEGQAGALRGWLERLESWRCRVVLTCRTPRYDRSRLIPWASISEYQLSVLDAERMRRLFVNWLGPDGGAELLERVYRNPALLESCQSPLIASLVCWMALYGRVPRGELRRGDLYGQVLRTLVGRPWRAQPAADSEVTLDEKLNVLREAAWRLFERRPESNDFRGREVQEALAESLKQLRDLGYKFNPAQLFAEFLDAAIVQRVGEDRYAFLHRTFLEYLAGRALAERATDQWDKWEEKVDRWAWHPAWWETLVFAGWKMEDPEPLVKLLADRARDDFFRHRLILALRVLAERS
jgi:hypothetical protein